MARLTMERVSNLLNVDLPTWSPRPIQLSCPVKSHHPTGDVHMSARYYPETDSIACFTVWKSWTPLMLYAELAQMPIRTAMDHLRSLGFEFEKRSDRNLSSTIANIFSMKRNVEQTWGSASMSIMRRDLDRSYYELIDHLRYEASSRKLHDEEVAILEALETGDHR